MRGIIENHFSPDLMCSQKMLLTAGHTLIIPPHQNYNSAFALHSAKAAKRARPKKKQVSATLANLQSLFFPQRQFNFISVSTLDYIVMFSHQRLPKMDEKSCEEK